MLIGGRTAMRCVLGVVLVVVVLGAWPGAAVAQPGAVTLTGTIVDSSGGVVPGATVEAVVNGRTAAEVDSGPDGTYRLAVPTGAIYYLRVSRAGFAVEVTSPVRADVNMTVDVTLRVGALDTTVVVTASGAAESLATVAESVSVFTADDLAVLGAASVADVLAVVPGLSVAATGREGSQTSLFSRGAESDHNLVLIDGVRVNQSGGAFDFSRIAAGEIDRVEVVRGAQSALYGSDAIGSVVQIFTTRAGASDAPVLSGSIEGGSFGTVRGDAHVAGGAAGRVDYSAGVAVRGTDGAFADLLPEDDRFDETSYHLGLGAALSDRVSLRTGLRYADARGRAVGPIDYGSRDTGTVYDSTSLSWSLESTHLWAPSVTGTARVGYFRYESASDDRVADPTYDLYAVLAGTPGAIFPASPRLVRFIDRPEFDAIASGAQSLQPGQLLATAPYGVSDFPFTFTTEFRRPTFDYSAAWTWRPGQVLTAGYAWERQSDPLTAGFEISNHAYFVQQQLTVADDWFLHLGARVDDNSHFGVETSPKISFGGYPVPFGDGAVSSVKVFTSLGRGIKNPTFSELFGGDFADGNPDLSAERAITADAGVELTFGSQRARVSATYFRSQYEDQVAYYPTGFSPDGLPDFVNVGGSEAHGVELEVALQRPLAGFTAAATYALVDTEVTATTGTDPQFQLGQPLLRRPRHSGTLRVGYARGPARVSVDLRAVGQRHDAGFLFLTSVATPQFDQQDTLVDVTVNPGYTVMGLTAEVDAREAVIVFVRVDNLADERYESALGYPGAPRSVMVGARFRIGE